MYNIFLRPLEIGDTKNIVKWRNNPLVKKNLYSQTELTEAQHIDYYNRIIKTGRCVQYIIVACENNKSYDIGTTFIKNIDNENKKGEFGIFIGEDWAKGQGFSKDAIHKILDVAFSELALNKVYLTVMSDNVCAVKSYRNTGFSVEGILREDFLRSDGFVDVIMMSLLKKEWLECE